jgi:hypothetical protein
MRTITFKSFFMALVMAFSAPLFAQISDAEVAALLGTNPSADRIAEIATAMAEQGAFTAQITAALVRAGVAPAAATVAVRTAIPSASTQQLSRGLAQAGVDIAVAASAINTANLTRPATTQVPAVVDSAGAIVGTDGRALSFDTPQQMLGAVAAFLSTQQQLSRIQINAIRGVADTYRNSDLGSHTAVRAWLDYVSQLVDFPSIQGPRLAGVAAALNRLAQSISDNDSEGRDTAVNLINGFIASNS